MELVSSHQGEKTIEFAHVWRFKVPATLRSLLQKTFTTAHGVGLYQWSVGLLPEYNEPPINRRRQVRSRSAALILDPYDESWKMPCAEKCLFTMVIRHPVTNKVVLEADRFSTQPNGNPEDFNDEDFIPSFRIRRNTDFAQKMNDVFAAQRSPYAGHYCEIATIITMPLSIFSFSPWIHLAPPTPLEPTFATTVLYEEHRHNFSIVSSDNEVFRTSREALFMSSGYFRGVFKGAGRNTVSLDESQFSIHAIKTTVFFMITSTFAAPPIWTPQIAEECLKLGIKYMSIDTEAFRNTIEKLCCENLESQPLDLVVKWLLIAEKHYLPTLEYAVYAILITRRSHEFQFEYTGPNVAPHRRATVEKLNRRESQWRPSIMSRIVEYRIETQHVMPIEE